MDNSLLGKIVFFIIYLVMIMILKDIIHLIFNMLDVYLTYINHHRLIHSMEFLATNSRLILVGHQEIRQIFSENF